MTPAVLESPPPRAGTRGAPRGLKAAWAETPFECGGSDLWVAIEAQGPDLLPGNAGAVEGRKADTISYDLCTTHRQETSRHPFPALSASLTLKWELWCLSFLSPRWFILLPLHTPLPHGGNAAGDPGPAGPWRAPRRQRRRGGGPPNAMACWGVSSSRFHMAQTIKHKMLRSFST